MASADWALLTDGVGAATVPRGPTSGFTPPNGGGTYVHVFNSLSTGVVGAVGRAIDLTNFNPTGANLLGSITGAMKRLPSSGATGFAPMLFIGLQGASVNNEGYLLGLQDEDPSAIVLRKGILSGGLPAGNAGVAAGLGILRKSTDTFANDTWVHLRLDATVDGTGDVTLEVFRNDLDVNTVTAPVWEAVPGMDDFVDDVAGINSGSVPFTSGRSGFAFYLEDISRRAAFDHITATRQL